MLGCFLGSSDSVCHGRCYSAVDAATEGKVGDSYGARAGVRGKGRGSLSWKRLDQDWRGGAGK